MNSSLTCRVVPWVSRKSSSPDELGVAHSMHLSVQVVKHRNAASTIEILSSSPSHAR